MKSLKIISSIIILAAAGGYFYYDTYYPRPYALASTYISKDVGYGGRDSVPQEVKFEIDGQPYVIKPDDRDLIALPIGVGNHTVTRGGKILGEIHVGWFDGKSILNLEVKPFVLVDVVYAENREKYQEKIASLPQNTITVNGRKYTGAFQYVEPALYLKKDWDYSPVEPPPGDIQAKKAVEVKKHLMREMLFEGEYRDLAQ